MQTRVHGNPTEFNGKMECGECYWFLTPDIIQISRYIVLFVDINNNNNNNNNIYKLLSGIICHNSILRVRNIILIRFVNNINNTAVIASFIYLIKTRESKTGT